MKKLLLLLIIAFCCISQASARTVVVVGGGVPAAGGPTYIIEEDCDGTGTPTGWTDTLSPDWDYTTTALRGSQSVALSSTTDGQRSQKTFSALTSFSAFFRFRFTSLPAVDRAFFILRNSSDTIIARLRLRASGAIRAYHGSIYATSAGTYSINTTYYVWVDWVKGTGADGALTAYIGTSTTKPSATISVTTGDATTDAEKLEVYKEGTDTTTFIFDQILLDDATIGDVPS